MLHILQDRKPTGMRAGHTSHISPRIWHLASISANSQTQYPFHWYSCDLKTMKTKRSTSVTVRSTPALAIAGNYTQLHRTIRIGFSTSIIGEHKLRIAYGNRRTKSIGLRQRVRVILVASSRDKGQLESPKSVELPSSCRGSSRYKTNFQPVSLKKMHVGTVDRRFVLRFELLLV